jgi:TM2 domain-containing membrane protein YozV
VYNGKRQKPDTILITTCLGFVIVAGVQRFILGQIGMGILYLLTGGLCLIGTIIDLINYRRMTYEFNMKMANESLSMIDSLK